MNKSQVALVEQKLRVHTCLNITEVQLQLNSGYFETVNLKVKNMTKHTDVADKRPEMRTTFRRRVKHAHGDDAIAQHPARRTSTVFKRVTPTLADGDEKEKAQQANHPEAEEHRLSDPELDLPADVAESNDFDLPPNSPVRHGVEEVEEARPVGANVGVIFRSQPAHHTSVENTHEEQGQNASQTDPFSKVTSLRNPGEIRLLFQKNFKIRNMQRLASKSVRRKSV